MSVSLWKLTEGPLLILFLNKVPIIPCIFIISMDKFNCNFTHRVYVLWYEHSENIWLAICLILLFLRLYTYKRLYLIDLMNMKIP